MKCPVCRRNTDLTLICDACFRSYNRANVHENNTFAIIQWAASRAREYEHKRMIVRVMELEEKLRIEIATTDGLIRKYGKTTTEIGDMNAKQCVRSEG